MERARLRVLIREEFGTMEQARNIAPPVQAGAASTGEPKRVSSMSAAAIQNENLSELFKRLQDLRTELQKHNPGTNEFHAILNDILHVRGEYNQLAETILGIVFYDL
jgi:hypothetical protein